MKRHRSFLIPVICLVVGFTATVLVAQQAHEDLSAEDFGAGANLVVTSVSGPTTALLNQTISLTYKVRNQGDAPSGAYNVGLYLSTNKTIDPATDTLLGSVTISTVLAPGESKRKSTKVLVPINASSGKYYYGAVVESSKKTSSKQVAVARYTLGDNNETVTDHKTAMIWQRADDGTDRNWADANQYCQDLVLGASADWRLPTVEELFSLADRSKFDPAIDSVFNCRSGDYWSSSASASNPDEAWLVGFHYGNAFWDLKDNKYYVRCMCGVSGSNPVFTVPGAPTGVAATTGNAQATVSFSPPASNGGSPITSYTVTSKPGGKTATGASTPITVTGLTNGTAYTFTVKATNSVGTGPPSSPSNGVTPMGSATVPGSPTGVAAIAGNSQAIVTFMDPASNGGSPILSYTVTSNPEGKTATGTSSPITVTGLTNGTTYTFTVAATNAVGTGPDSSPSNSVILPTVPGAPTGVAATAGNAQAVVTFIDPASNGGSFILSYTVTSDPGGITAMATSSPITVTGLTNGTAYTFTVKATNAVGTGLISSPSNSVTPIGPATIPGAPTGATATAGNAQATVSFTVPVSNGGSPIISYTVTSSPGGITATGSSSPIIVTGLINGAAYTFTVRATNAVGAGSSSSPSNSVMPGSPYSVSGRVATSEGTGIPGVTMKFRQSMNSTGNPPTMPAAVTTDTNGNWSQSGFSGTPWATYVVRPDFGYVMSPEEMEFWTPRSDLNFTRRYVNNGDGTVTDTVTGLMWQKTDDGVGRNGTAGESYCAALILGGHDDWRLPASEDELQTIVARYFDFKIDPAFDGRSACYVTSKICPSVGHQTYWAKICFQDGLYWCDLSPSGGGSYVRCVRGGP